MTSLWSRESVLPAFLQNVEVALHKKTNGVQDED